MLKDCENCGRECENYGEIVKTVRVWWPTGAWNTHHIFPVSVIVLIPSKKYKNTALSFEGCVLFL